MRDPVLTAMVASGGGFGLPVTLLSAGSTIEGVITTEARWFDRLAEVLEAPGTAGAGAVARVFREVRMAVELNEVVEGVPVVDFVHLVDAVLRSGGQLQSVGLWRVRLEDVSGWKLGAALPARLRAVE